MALESSRRLTSCGSLTVGSGVDGMKMEEVRREEEVVRVRWACEE
jgi:hypothetical protein